MNYYNEIKNKLVDNEIYSKVKDYSKERHRVITYYEIGKLLSEAGSAYGEGIIEKYAEKLTLEVGKKYNKRTLFRMRQFYEMFKEQKVSTVWTQLSWSHYRLLLPFNDINKICYYVKICKEQSLGVRDLERKIKSKEYERLPEITKKKINKDENQSIEDYIKNPIIIKSNNDYEIISEKVLQKLILEDIPYFLKELGNRYNYIDLLLFNIEYNCYTVVELKATELKKEHIGQIQIYMNYIDDNLKKNTQDKTIGIIICKQDNRYVIKYSSDNRIIAREYNLTNM